MKPIVIFCHTRTEEPGYFAIFLDRRMTIVRHIKSKRSKRVIRSSRLCLTRGIVGFSRD
jgi:hypothetical protein